MEWREIERELVGLFQSFGRTVVHDRSGEPHIEYVRVHEQAADDTIYEDGINALSLTFLARHLANKFRGTPSTRSTRNGSRRQPRCSTAVASTACRNSASQSITGT
jgi:hypothetical protein